MNRQSKADLVWDIAQVLGVEVPPMSTGSREPKAIFLLVNEAFGLGIPRGWTKPELAKGIVEASGDVWGVGCESRGGTITLEGLHAVRRAVRFFAGA